MYTMWAIWAYNVHFANWMWKYLNSSTFAQCHKNIRVLNVNWIEEENKLKSKTEQIKSLCRSSGCTPLIKPLTILPNAFCAAVHENFMVSLYSLYVCSKRKCRSDKQKPDIHTFSLIHWLCSHLPSARCSCSSYFIIFLLFEIHYYCPFKGNIMSVQLLKSSMNAVHFMRTKGTSS